MPSRHAAEFDVTEAAGLGQPARISATLFLPEAPVSGDRLVLLVPGGGFTRRYYDLELDGYRDYSSAMSLAGRGLIPITIDNLGTGESTIPEDGHAVTLDRSASALAEVVRQLRERARTGALHPSLAAVEAVIVGIGHSLGGCIMTLAQGEHRCCDAIGILGYSCRYIVGAVDPETGVRLRAREYAGNGYNQTSPLAQRTRFYSDDVPIAVIEAEETGRVPMPNGVAEALIPGRTVVAAAKIEVPVLLLFGETDVSPEPHAEPSFYHRSKDVTLLMIEGARHAHNSASCRVALWNRIVRWIDSVVPVAG